MCVTKWIWSVSFLLSLLHSYISKVDVLKILVTANYKFIPSLEEILEMSAVTRLRNQLLETEHYQLAVEVRPFVFGSWNLSPTDGVTSPIIGGSLCQVSTKSGLDPSGVWQAWALASLKARSLSGAREKFSRCMKVPVDRNQLSLGPLLLQEVVQHLETSVRLTQSTVGHLDLFVQTTV